MRSSASPSCILLCLSAFCLFSLAASITLTSSAVLTSECGPAGSDLPRCNGTITASYDALNCQGNVTYRSGSSEEAVTGQCRLAQAGGPVFSINQQCVFGQPTTMHQYAYTPNDRGNCTQPHPLATAGLGTVGACINDHSSNTSEAMLCDLSQVPFQISTTVTAGPVVLQPFSGSQICYAPDRCDALIYTTTYSDEHCGRSQESRNLIESDLKLGICYDYRASVSGESQANVMYSFDGTYFRIALYYGGCSGPTAEDIKLLTDTCYISAPGQSTIIKTNIVASNPVSQLQDPAGASSSMHGSIQISIFVSFMVSFFAILLSVTA